MQIAYPFMWFLPPVYWAVQRFRPGLGAAVLLPSSVLRFLTFKLQWDLQQIPAMHELARVALRVLFNGDVSQWDRAIQMPHYNTQSMPAISLHTAMHLIQARPLPAHCLGLAWLESLPESADACQDTRSAGC